MHPVFHFPKELPGTYCLLAALVNGLPKSFISNVARVSLQPLLGPSSGDLC